MRKTINQKLIYVGIFLLIAFLILFLISVWDGHQQLSSDGRNDHVLVYEGKEYVLKDNIETFLILGLDKFQNAPASDSYNNDQQADFLMLLVVDNDAQTVSVLPINRDTMAQVNVLGLNGNQVSTVTEQIALAHTYGNGGAVSCRNTADSVSALLNGMRIHHYISLKMDSVSVFNDLVGGVTLEILDDFPGEAPSLQKGETVTLTGEQALMYVRSRQGMADDSNIARMARQNQYVKALYNQAKHRMETDEGFLVDASLQMKEYLLSDRSLTQLRQLADKLNAYDFIEMDSIRGESREGEKFMEFHADADHVQEIVVQLFYELKD